MDTRTKSCRTWTIAQQLRSTYIINMKAIQVMFDEDLLAQLDADEDVKKKGRSAVLREAAAAYLERRRRALIADGYQSAYAGQEGIGAEFEGWEEEGEWPSE